MSGMGDQSRRPRSSPESLGEEVDLPDRQLKERHRYWGPRKIREVYLRRWGEAPSESSFKRVLERCGLTEKRKIRRAQEAGRIATGRKAMAPNEVWSVDFKGWWHDPEGRCDPLTVRDEYSRYLAGTAGTAECEDGDGARPALSELFERHGLPGAIRSDNGPPFACAHGLMGLSRLSAWWLANGVDLERSRPGCPQDNGAHERMHRDIARELERAGYAERQAALETWRCEFNEERPHETLGMKMPAEIYVPSARRWGGTPEQIIYREDEYAQSQHAAATSARGRNDLRQSGTCRLARWALQRGQMETSTCTLRSYCWASWSRKRPPSSQQYPRSQPRAKPPE